MAQVYKKLEIDVNKEVTSIITAVQNDAQSRYLDVVLLDGSTAINLTGHEVRIYGKKADGKEFYNNGEITNATAGRCQFELTSQALAVAQDLEVQIIIFKDNVEILSTQSFTIHVVKSLISTSAIPSSNEYGALVVLYQNLYEAYDLMTTMVQNIGVPGEIAEQLTIDTMWDAWEYLCNYVSEDLTTLIQNALNNNSVDGVIQRIGETTDTGATETAGTVMGKLNRIQTKEDELSEKIIPDIDFIRVGFNYPSYTYFRYLTSTDTEILNVSGTGIIETLYITATTATTKIKVYVDSELLFDFGVYSISSARGHILAFGSATSNKLSDFRPFVGGNIANNESISVATGSVLMFKNNLRIVAASTASNADNYVRVSYGLKG